MTPWNASWSPTCRCAVCCPGGLDSSALTALALHHGDVGAAKILDRALAVKDERPTPVQLLRMLVLRGDVAQRLGESERTAGLLERAAAVELTDTAARSRQVRDEPARLAELRESLRET